MASNVPALFAASFQIDQRKEAEAQLEALTAQKGFLPHLLDIVLDRSQPLQVRQAACVYFKNQIRRRWDEEESPITTQDKKTIRDNLVFSMVNLAEPSDRLLRTQIGEAVSSIAGTDFPDLWGDLVSRLVASLSPSDYTVNLAVLQTAHNIFSSWKFEIRSDALYATINLALSQFQEPYFALFRATATRLLEPASSTMEASALQLLGDTMDMLFNLFHDMTAQDLPPVFEDAQDEFFGKDSQAGWFLKFLQWNPPQFHGDSDDASPNAPLRIRTTILEICELYTARYNELSTPRLPVFVQAVWELIGSSSQAVREDAMVAQAIRFLSVNVKSGTHTDLFRQQETLQAMCQRIIVPSMALREHEEEQFEDDPLEFIRRDLSLSVEGAGATRRHAASELVRSLISVGLEAEVTSIVQAFVAAGLASYVSNPTNWKDKDTALYLFTSVASLGSTASKGVTSTNILVDVVKFFSDNVYADLQAEGRSAHPILQVDAIRFIYQFRYQLTKEQLLSVLPLLIQHLASQNYVTYTYAAITIERILFIKHGNAMLFSQADIHETAQPILAVLFAKIRKERTPQKVAENDYLMKCVMRVIITARQTLTPTFQNVLSNLIAILELLCQNPSNPTFDQYTFESISALLRFVVAGNPSTLEAFENVLFGPVRVVLQQDIDQYVPYVLQIVAQMLEMRGSSVPAVYGGLFPLLITPVVWQQKGSIPPLVRLIKAYLQKDAASIVVNGQLTQILGVVQQRLIPSKINDTYGFELIEAVVTNIPVAELQKNFNAVMLTLLNRLQTTRTDKYAVAFARFLCFMMALNVGGLTPAFVVGAVEAIQPGLWSTILVNVALPQIPKQPMRDRKLVAVGLIRLLTQCEPMLSPPAANAWPPTLLALLELLSKSGATNTDVLPDDAPTELSEIDHEEQTVGYQAAYSRLAASEGAKTDPVAYVSDAPTFLRSELGRINSADPRVPPLVANVASQTPLLAQLMG